MSKFRIGIDVGGTFTHAVAINNSTYELAGQVKVSTTHKSENGVADGIIESLLKLLKDCSIDPSDVVFIAHSTTQATNALLEGDVCPVGILAVGQGLEGKRVKSETDIGDVDLGEGKKIKVHYRFTGKEDLNEENIKTKLSQLISDGASSIVAAEAFSVDDPANEKFIMETAGKMGIPATGTHEISGLYGLKIRTRTAVINASILPKMMETASATQKCVESSGIKAPLMIMRSDGGVMNIEQVKKRPILTILSGPAAGIASALLYVKISDGIFLEVGGTSTDIAVIRNGKAAVRSSEIGGHKLYLRTLDSRTVGIAGGSMPRISGGKMIDVGPRSAHIAGLKYASFSKPEELKGQEPVKMQDDYYSIGGKYAVTTTCAANALGLAKRTDWAFGNKEAADLGLQILNLSPDKILETACAKISKAIENLIKDYKLDKNCVTLIGGGGGAAAIVPFTAKLTGMNFRTAENHAVLSAIGAALAMVSDTIERTVIDPSEEDILKIRKEAEDSVARMGADPGTIEVTVEIDRQKNVVRASASGSVEFRQRELFIKELPVEERKNIARSALKNIEGEIKLSASSEWFDVWEASTVSKTMFNLLRSKKQEVRVIDREGIVRMAKTAAKVFELNGDDKMPALKDLLQKHTVYGDAGERAPSVYILLGRKIIDLSSLAGVRQITALAELELKNSEKDDKIIVILGI